MPVCLLHGVLRSSTVNCLQSTDFSTSAQAQDMHAHIRSVIAAKYEKDAAENMTILYGGSCKPSNAAELFACPDVDGGLIGGASLKASDFLGIIEAMADL